MIYKCQKCNQEMKDKKSKQWEGVIINPGAIVSSTAKIGKGTVIWSYSIIGDDVEIGDWCVIGSHSYIGKGTKIGDFSRLQTGVFIPNNCNIGRSVFIGPRVVFTDDRYPIVGNKEYNAKPPIIEDNVSIGAGAVILPGVKIWRGAMIGAGAVVTKEVAPGTLSRQLNSAVSIGPRRDW